MSVPPIQIDSFWLPRQGSTIAAEIDWEWNVVMWISVIFFILIVGAMFWFMYRYRRKSEDQKTSDVVHNNFLELAWSVVPLVLVVWLFFVGLTGYINASVAPAESLHIQVTAQQWTWTFTYPNGTVSGDLVVPKGKPVQLVMSSRDVIHSFWVPEFRVKRDVIPGLYTSVWFEANKVEDTVLECTEYCGAGHSAMLATVRVLSQDKFQDWLDNGGEEKGVPPAKQGEKLFTSFGCATCHLNQAQAPSLKGLLGRTETLSDGSTIVADENYIRESIETSTAKVVKGFNPIMPVFKGVLKDKQIDALVAFVKEQK